MIQFACPEHTLAENAMLAAGKPPAPRLPNSRMIYFSGHALTMMQMAQQTINLIGVLFVVR